MWPGISPVMTKLFNLLQLATGTVPTAWKTSTVVPVPKCSANNYIRPLKLLSNCITINSNEIAQ